MRAKISIATIITIITVSAAFVIPELYRPTSDLVVSVSLRDMDSIAYSPTPAFYIRMTNNTTEVRPVYPVTISEESMAAFLHGAVESLYDRGVPRIIITHAFSDFIGNWTTYIFNKDGTWLRDQRFLDTGSALDAMKFATFLENIRLLE